MFLRPFDGACKAHTGPAIILCCLLDFALVVHKREREWGLVLNCQLSYIKLSF